MSSRIARSIPVFLGSMVMFDALAQPTANVSMLSAEESTTVTRTLLSEARVREIIGGGEPRVTVTLLEPDKAEAEAFLDGRSSTPPNRRASVVLFNAETNRAARALVSIGQNRILSVDRLAATEVPFAREDAEQALALARANAAVRRVVGDSLDRYELLESGSDAVVPFAAQVLPMRSTAANDPCRVDRCVGIVFRNEAGYLALRVQVDLTRRTVQVYESRRQHQ